jgi:hypothetical protein
MLVTTHCIPFVTYTSILQTHIRHSRTDNVKLEQNNCISFWILSPLSLRYEQSRSWKNSMSYILYEWFDPHLEAGWKFCCDIFSVWRINSDDIYIRIIGCPFISCVHLNLSSKLALKSRLWTHHSSVSRVKTQTRKVKLDLNSWYVILFYVNNWLSNAGFEDKFKWTPGIIICMYYNLLQYNVNTIREKRSFFTIWLLTVKWAYFFYIFLKLT